MAIRGRPLDRVRVRTVRSAAMLDELLTEKLDRVVAPIRVKMCWPASPPRSLPGSHVKRRQPRYHRCDRLRP